MVFGPYLQRVVSVLTSLAGKYLEHVPGSHRAFSRLDFSLAGGQLAELAEDEDDAVGSTAIEPVHRSLAAPTDANSDMPTGAGISDDEIEDW